MQAEELWVSSEIGGTVTAIDPTKHEIKSKIAFEIPGLRKEAIQAVGISITADGRTGFVAFFLSLAAQRQALNRLREKHQR